MPATPRSDPAHRPVPLGRQHMLVLLALAAIGCAVATVTDYGNTLGIDDWIHTYYTLNVDGLAFASRPLAMLWLKLIVPTVRVNYATYYVIVTVFTITDAFLIYLTVRLLAPRVPLFAVTAGVLFLVYFVDDFFLLLDFMYTGNYHGAVLLTLLGLAGVTVYLRAERLPWLARIAGLIIGCAAAVVSLLIVEAGFPLLLGVPVVAVIANRDGRWPTLAGLALWLVALLAAAAPTLLPALGLGGESYGSSLIQDLNANRMLSAAWFQLQWVYRRLLILDLARVWPFRLAALVVGAVTFAGLILLHNRVTPPADAPPTPDQPVARYALWTVGGLLFVLGSVAPFLPTIYARSPIRTHVIGRIPESVLLAALIWLVAAVVRGARWQRLARYVGVGMVVLYGVTVRGEVQSFLYEAGGSWENAAHFMRSVTHLAPGVDGPTLIVNIENPATDEAPFVSGFSFQYAVRYFYDDQATGLIPTDSILGEWEVQQAGIHMTESWVREPHLYPWDAMIFISRDESGRVMVLDEIAADVLQTRMDDPDSIDWAAAQAAYAPHARIVDRYLPARMLDAYPIVASPDVSR